MGSKRDLFTDTGLDVRYWLYSEGQVFNPSSEALVNESSLTDAQLTALLTAITEGVTSEATGTGRYTIDYATITNLPVGVYQAVYVQGAALPGATVIAGDSVYWDGANVLEAEGTGNILAKLNAAVVQVTGPVLADQAIEIVEGDDYDAADGRALSWTVEDWTGPAVGTLTVTFRLMTRTNYEAGTGTAALSVTGSVALAGADAVFTAELTAAQTGALSPVPPASKYNYVYQLLAVDGAGDVLTQVVGPCTVTRRVTP